MAFALYQSLYHSYEYGAFTGIGFYRKRAPREKLTLNVIRNMISAVHSKVAKNRTRPMFVTSGGDASQQRRAKAKTKFCDGIFYETKVYEKAPIVDSLKYGTGILKWFERDGRVACEVVHCNEWLVDHVEAYHGEPRNFYHRKWVDKEALIAAYPDFEDQLEPVEADSSKDDDGDVPAFDDSTTAQLLIVEAWHIPTSKDAKNGRHVIAVKDGPTLVDEPWERMNPPVAVLRWTSDDRDWWGTGLCEELMSIQREINRIGRFIQRCQKMIVGHWLLDRNSGIATKHINDELGDVLTHNGTPSPLVWTGGQSVISPEIYEREKELYQKAYEISGVSQLSAQSQKPPGIDSGKALSTFENIESQRFYVFSKALETFYIDCAERALEIVRDIGDVKVNAPDKNRLIELNAKDVLLEEDTYIVQAFPTSSLSQDPAMRMQQVENLKNAGYIEDAGEAKRLLDMPDLESDADLSFAKREVIDMQLERITDEGIYEPPEPFSDIGTDPATSYALHRAQAIYNRGKMTGLEPERLEMLQTYMLAAKALLPPPPPPPALPGPPGMPPGPAGMPPVSPGPPMPPGPMQ